jgi:serine/threonine protein kinase
MNQVFARKVIRIFGGVTEKDILNEARAAGKLCAPPTHKNIVCVFRQDWLSKSESLYYLDMQYCDFNLDCWIHGHRSSKLERIMPRLEGNRMTQIWNVMRDLTSGVAFIHSRSQVHRDLKPGNSNSLSVSQDTDNSFVFYHRSGLENRRLRAYIRRHIKTGSNNSLCPWHPVIPLA